MEGVEGVVVKGILKNRVGGNDRKVNAGKKGGVGTPIDWSTGRQHLIM